LKGAHFEGALLSVSDVGRMCVTLAVGLVAVAHSAELLDPYVEAAFACVF
jgi:hypothetical protein